MNPSFYLLLRSHTPCRARAINGNTLVAVKLRLQGEAQVWIWEDSSSRSDGFSNTAKDIDSSNGD